MVRKAIKMEESSSSSSSESTPITSDNEYEQHEVKEEKEDPLYNIKTFNEEEIQRHIVNNYEQHPQFIEFQKQKQTLNHLVKACIEADKKIIGKQAELKKVQESIAETKIIKKDLEKEIRALNDKNQKDNDKLEKRREQNEFYSRLCDQLGIKYHKINVDQFTLAYKNIPEAMDKVFQFNYSVVNKKINMIDTNQKMFGIEAIENYFKNINSMDDEKIFQKLVICTRHCIQQHLRKQSQK